MNLWTSLAGAAVQLLGIGLREVMLSAIVFAVVWPVTRAMGRRAPALQLALWSLVLLRLVLPPGLASPISAGALAGRMISVASADGSGAAASLSGLAPLGWEPGGGHAPASVPFAGGWLQAAALVLLALWLAGLGLAAGRAWRRGAAYRRLIRSAVPIEDPAVVRVADAWCRRLGLRCRIRLLASTRPVAPFTAGVVRPCVVIPTALLGTAAPTTLEAVVAHELVHVARHDAVWIVLQRAVAALYFFNPLVRAANARIDERRENLVDAVVLGSGAVSKQAYARGIVEVLRARLDPVAAPALSPGQKGVLMRLVTVLDPRPVRPPRRRLAAVAAVIAGAFLLPLATVKGSAPAGEPPVMRPAEPSAPPALPAAEPAAAPAPVPAVEPASVAIHREPPLPAPLMDPAQLKLLVPVAGGRVTAAFGPIRDPFTGETRHHDGLDIAAPAGRPVRAPAPGVVTTAATTWVEPAWGTVVIIDHGNGDSSLFAHLGELLVEAGARVERGDQIALVGSTGRSTGPHVHFELRREGVSVDPTPLVLGLH